MASALAMACGGSDRPETIGQRDTGAGAASNNSGSNTGGSSGSAGSGGGVTGGSGGDGASGGSGGSGGGASASAPPIVELIQPEHENAPDEVYDVDLPVSCLVEQSDEPDAAPPDPSSISVDLIDEEGEVLDTRVGVEGDEENIYEVTFPVQNLPSGMVTVRCSAADSSANPTTASDEANTFLDHGPVISIISPEPDSPESARGAVVFEYEVVPDELVDDDEGAALEEVTLKVRGRTFPIDEVEEGVYRTTVDFEDTTIFPEVPEGSVSVSVAATNTRGITRTTLYDFLLDSTGPDVEILSPATGSIVDGTVSVRIGVPDDGSGVDLDSIEVTLNDDPPHTFTEGTTWSVEGEDVVVFQFETREVGGSFVQITVNVSAADEAGNIGNDSAIYYRDEYGPIVSLDPPLFRERNTSNGQCSHVFDPLGSQGLASSPEPGAVIRDGARLRVLAWDRTNVGGGDIQYLSMVDKSSVRLFVRAAGEPIVVDTTGDGNCDDIRDEGLRYQNLAPVPPAGTPWFGPETEADPELESEGPPIDACTGYGTQTTAPKTLCDQYSDLTAVAHFDGIPNEPVVYAIPPLTGPECTGRYWELGGVFPDYEGWICVAARALDNVGNRGISKPIALCLDNYGVPGEPPCSNESPPNCQGDCADPPALPAAGVIYDD